MYKLGNSGTVKARYFKFYVQIEQEKHYRKDNKLPKWGVVSITWPSFVVWDLLPKFWLGDAEHLKFRTEIEYTI